MSIVFSRDFDIFEEINHGSGPDITFSATTPRTRRNSAGILEYAPHNILENANCDDNGGGLPSGWSNFVDAGGKTYEQKNGYWEFTVTAAANRPALQNTIIGLEAERRYTIGMYIVLSDMGAGANTILRSSGSGGTDGLLRHLTFTTEGWYAIGIKMGVADTSFSFQIGAGATSADTGTTIMSRPFIVKGLLPGVVVGGDGVKISGEPSGKWVATSDGDEPLFLAPFDYDVNNNALGFRPEEASTNLALGSEDASDNTAETRVTVSTDTTDAADGQTTADSILETAVTDTHHLDLDAVSISASTAYTLSFFVKALTNDYVEIDWLENGGSVLNPHAVFRFSTGAFVLSSGVGETFVEDWGGGIFRISFTATTEGDATTAQPRIWTNTDGTHQQSFAGNTANGVVVWGKSLEATAIPLSYVSTLVAAVARTADVASASVTGLLGAENTMFVQGTTGYGASVIYQIDDGTEDERYRIERNASNEIHVIVTDGGVDQADLNLGAVADITEFKVAVRLAASDFAASLDGASVVTDAGGTLPTVDTLRPGMSSANEEWNAPVGKVYLWDEGKSDAEIEALALDGPSVIYQKPVTGLKIGLSL